MPRRAHESLVAALLIASALGGLTACRKDKASGARPSVSVSAAEAAQRAGAARRALDELKPKLSALDSAIAALHREFDPLPPGLPGFGPTRSRFYATAEGFGMLGAKVPSLSSRINAAEQARDGAQLATVSKDVAKLNEEIRQVDRLAVELLHEVQPFKSAKEEPFGPPPTKCE